MKIAIGQINPTVGDLAGNYKKISNYIFKACQENCDFITFPELAITGYPPEDLVLNPNFIHDNKNYIMQLARDIDDLSGYDICAIVGFIDSDANHIYNAAAIISNGFVQVYHKHELPNYGVFDERRYFTPGKTESIYSHNRIKFGVNICEDIWIDGGIYIRQAQAGAQILFNISASPYHVQKHSIREKLILKRYEEIKIPIIYTNMVGGQDELIFDGGSIASKTYSFFKEDLFIFDTKNHIYKFEDSFNNNEEEIYSALILGTRDYCHKNGFSKVVLGISGGIDSALVAKIATDAIGAENVIGISMPSRYNSQATQNDARTLASNLGITFKEIPISSINNAYLSTLKKEFSGLESGIAEENIQARIRGNILMAMSNKFGYLVLSTSNKSEAAVGYGTLYGDMAGGFNPIKDVYKTQVFDICKWINTSSKKDIIPNSIITRPPSAELRDNQRDEDSLPPYNVLDYILKHIIERDYTVEDFVSKNNKAVAARVIKLIKQSEYKRRQSPPGIKISPRGLGKDWRYPITNKYLL